ncbi:hypothetical protein C2S52_008744 [Perilla frutescens var. hirtella]|nr:hypothetical protein C2S52_008744 [Perilla frutescens var. hirtella]
MSSGRCSFGSLNGGGKVTSKDKGKKRAPELDVVGGTISARGQSNDIMKEVRERLSRKNLQAFRKTCFGHLLDVPPIQYQWQLIFRMLNALESESESRNTDSISIQKLSEMILAMNMMMQIALDKIFGLEKNVAHEAMSPLEAEIDMNKAPSPEYEIFDLSTYSLSISPDKTECMKKLPKKKLFEKASEVPTPRFRGIPCEPLAKKVKKAKGENMNQQKLVQLASVMWERFHPFGEYK